MTNISRFTGRDLDSLRIMGALDRCSVEIILGVARRCSYGAPQVLLCAPEKGARPFPTTFWLVCPHLAKIAGRVESRNGVSAMEAELASRGEEWRLYNLSHARMRLSLLPDRRRAFLLRYSRRMYDSIRGGGVGGVANFPRRSVKCVHLQIASYLGTGRHPAADWLDRNVPSWNCPDGICSP